MPHFCQTLSDQWNTTSNIGFTKRMATFVTSRSRQRACGCGGKGITCSTMLTLIHDVYSVSLGLLCSGLTTRVCGRSLIRNPGTREVACSLCCESRLELKPSAACTRERNSVDSRQMVSIIRFSFPCAMLTLLGFCRACSCSLCPIRIPLVKNDFARWHRIFTVEHMVPWSVSSLFARSVLLITCHQTPESTDLQFFSFKCHPIL